MLLQTCLLLHAGILVLHGIMNTIGTKLSAILNGFSTVWHMVGTLVLVITLLAVAPTHQSGHFTFATFYKVGMPEIASGITNNGYVFARMLSVLVCCLPLHAICEPWLLLAIHLFVHLCSHLCSAGVSCVFFTSSPLMFRGAVQHVHPASVWQACIGCADTV